jgi:hypothetical protein
LVILVDDDLLPPGWTGEDELWSGLKERFQRADSTVRGVYPLGETSFCRVYLARSLISAVCL